MTPSVSQGDVTTALRTFLLEVLESGWDVVLAQPNRVAEPKSDNFVVLMPIRQERLRTNVDEYVDAVFTGSIAGAVMTISAVDPDFDGQIAIGKTIFGVGVAAGTKVTELMTGTGGVGTYRVSAAQTIGSQTLAAGSKLLEQGARMVVQMDFHSAEPEQSGDAAVTVSTAMRDAYGYEQFANQSPNHGVRPLHADEATQRPFINESQQVEWRWVVEAHLQANIVVSVPMQFAGAVAVETISVDAAYPP